MKYKEWLSRSRFSLLFITKRFDRLDGGGKLHMQSLGAMAYFDYNDPGASSYEQAASIMNRLGIGQHEIKEFAT